MPNRGIPSVDGRPPAHFHRELAAVALLSMAALSLEIGLTRILSLVQWYHFAFMVVSIALFGYGAAGTFLSLLPSVRRDHRVPSVSAATCFCFVALSLFFSVAFRFDPIKANTSPLHAAMIVFQYLALGLPFFFTGICLASLITRRPSKANHIYFSDLSGAGVGCIFALGIMPFGGPHLAILGSAIAAAIACILLSSSEGLVRLEYVGAVGVAVLLLGTVGLRNYDPELSEYKGLSAVLRNPDAERVWSAWNSISRVDVVRSRLIHHAPGMPFDKPMFIPEQIGLTVDGDNLEPITRFDGNWSTVEFMGSLPTSIAYEIRARDRVLVIDSGGGFDVLASLANGAVRVVATEQNPNIVRAVREEFSNFSGGLYSREDVDLHTLDGRSFLGASDDSFDLVEISLKQDPVTASVGLYSLSESYLFTVESIREIFRHLTEDGVLAVTRWLSPPPRESARILSMMVEGLEEEGVRSPSEHLASFRSYLTVTILMKRSPFERDELAILRSICERRKFDLVYLPDISVDELNRFNVLERPDYYETFRRIIDRETRERFVKDYFFQLSPPTDEKPFFFDFLKWSRIWDLRRVLGKAWNPYLEGGLLVVAVVLQAMALSALFILVPILLAGRAKQHLTCKGRWIAYFLGLGAGYLLVEVIFLQRFILFLGQPAYAMGAVLFAMLVFSGLGSLWSSRLEPTKRIVGLAVLGVLVMIALHCALLAQIIRFFLGSHIWIKFLISVASIAPLAFVMGIPFPTGLRLLGRKNAEAIPLAYSANGCSSVVGSASTIVLGGWLGFSNVLLIGALIYLLSYVALPSRSK